MMKVKVSERFKKITTLHHYDEDKTEYIGSSNRKIYYHLDGKNGLLWLPFTWLDLFAFSRILSRLLRLDRVNILHHTRKSIILLRQNRIYRFDIRSGLCKKIFKSKNTRNILYGSSSEGGKKQIIFGDYGSLYRRKKKRIYRSMDDGRTWDVPYEFQANEIKQILNISWDKYQRIYWVLTGDELGQSKFYNFDENFRKIKIFDDNTLKYRAICIHFFRDKIFWITNDPYNGSKIYKLDRLSQDISLIGLISGSVWYSKKMTDGLFLIATAAEDLKTESNGEVKIFSSKDFIKWKHEASFKKDHFPKKFFRFGLASFPSGSFSSNNLYTNFEAVKVYDGKVARLIL